MTELRTIETANGLGYQLELEAAPAEVWRYWTEPARMVCWMGDVATLQPWPGGTFRVEYKRGDVAAGEFLDAERPQFLAFTWGWEEEGSLTPPGSSRVEVIFEELEGSRTLLRMRHTNQPAAALQNHDAGWRFFLPRLAEAVTRS
jgi:uncharacterized protein YndB with AHSA1/START domain